MVQKRSGLVSATGPVGGGSIPEVGPPPMRGNPTLARTAPGLAPPIKGAFAAPQSDVGDKGQLPPTPIPAEAQSAQGTGQGFKRGGIVAQDDAKRKGHNFAKGGAVPSGPRVGPGGAPPTGPRPYGPGQSADPMMRAVSGLSPPTHGLASKPLVKSGAEGFNKGGGVSISDHPGDTKKRHVSTGEHAQWAGGKKDWD